jgi:hemoglobin-like flavoprotein
MTPTQIQLVQSTFRQIAPFDGIIAGLFYNRLFKAKPELRAMFKSDLKSQGEKLMNALKFVVASLNDPERIGPVVKHLGQTHTTYGVTAEHYDTVGTALIWTLKQSLGPDFTKDVEAAWLAAYTMLAEVMKHAAAESETGSQINPPLVTENGAATEKDTMNTLLYSL